jgi:4-carboxymuconolactone decarboxylase
MARTPKAPKKAPAAAKKPRAARGTAVKLRPEFKTARFQKGVAMRRAVLGDAYVDASLGRANDFNSALQVIATEWAWNEVWTRPGLDLKTRSMLNIAMLSALGRSHELALHTRGAINNGVTREQIKEVLIQVGGYCGIPAAVEAFRVASQVLADIDAEKKK